MKSLEFQKYIEPKLSESCREIADYYSEDISLEPMYSDLSYPIVKPIQIHNSIEKFEKPNTKQQIRRFRNKIEGEGGNNDKLGMSQYYGKILDNFLGKPKSISQKKRNKPSISLDTQDFWLLNDKIKVIADDI